MRSLLYPGKQHVSKPRNSLTAYIQKQELRRKKSASHARKDVVIHNQKAKVRPVIKPVRKFPNKKAASATAKKPKPVSR